MSKRLAKALNIVVTREGAAGKGRLAEVIGRGARVIDYYLEERHRPTPSNAYKLALACGLGEEDALAIAKECASEKARLRTA